MRNAIAQTLDELEEQRQAQAASGSGSAGGARDRDLLMLAVGPDTGRLLKGDYPAYFDLVFPKLALGGLIVADNITRPAPPDAGITEYVSRARNHPDAQSQLLPVGSGLELTVRIRSSRPHL
jgi:hypothetical protein